MLMTQYKDVNGIQFVDCNDFMNVRSFALIAAG